MNNTVTTTTPSQSIIDDISSLGDDFILRVFNNDTTTFLEVIMVLMFSLPCDMPFAQSCAQQIDALGSCEVLKSTYAHCEEVQKALKGIKVDSEIISSLD